MISRATATRAGLSLTISTIVGLICVYAGIEAQSFRQVSSWFPTFVAAVGAVCAAVVMTRDLVTLISYRRHRRSDLAPEGAVLAPDPQMEDELFDLQTILSFAYWMGWLVLLTVFMIVIGGIWAPGIWLAVCLKLGSKTSWRFAAISALVLIALLYVLVNYAGFYVPTGMLGLDG